jgi:signal transduction histidine kinase
MKRSILLLFTAVCFSLSAQDSNVDSLLNVINTTKVDTLKLNALLDLSIAFQESNFEKSVAYGKDALIWAEKINNKKGIAQAYNSIANANSVQSNFSECIAYHQKALIIRTEIGDSYGIAASNNNLGNAYSDLGNFDKALSFYEIARTIDEKNKDKKSLTFVYNNIGSAYAEKGELKKAIDYIYKSLKLKEELGNLKGAANSANNIAVIYKMQGNLQEALNYNRKSLQYREQIKDSIGMGYSYSNIALAYRNLNELKACEENNIKAIKIFKAIGHKKGIAVIYNNLGSLYKTNNELTKSLSAFNDGLAIWEDIQDQKGLATAYTSLGSVYGKLNKYPEAESYFTKAEALSKSVGGFELLMETYDVMSVYYQDKGDFRTALKYHQLLTDAKDSLRGKESIAALADTKTKYETEKKEAENQLLVKENSIKTLENDSKQKTIFILIGGIVVAAIALLWLLSLARIRKQRLALETERQLQLDRERISRDLHDNVGGQLSYVLFSLEADEADTKDLRKAKSENLSSALRNVTSNLRETIWALNQDQLSLQDLSDKLKLYARNIFSYSDIKVKFEETIQNDIPLNPAFALNLFRICQEVINNVFKHADANELLIHFYRKDKIEIIITDNGKGFALNADTQNSYGLSNLKLRAEEIKADLNIQSELNKGTQIKIIV